MATFSRMFFERLERKVKRKVRCLLCRGTKLLCGKSRCPVLVRLYSQIKSTLLIKGNEVEGSSPPSIFVGRIGYPKVYIGPLVPPIHGDTSFLDTPELWHEKSLDEIVNFRCLLVRGKFKVNVKDVDKSGLVEDIIELALAKNSPDVETVFSKKPSQTIVLSDVVQPFGPSAPLKKMRISGVKSDQRIEKAYYDTDLKAEEAILELYKKGVLVSKIQRALSAGLFGIKRNRKFVPTRWSITAVDSIISKNLVDRIKEFPLINEYRVYEHQALDNRWIVLMIPSYWSYELIEAWYPGTTWNPDGKEIAIYSSHEFFEGRTEYAEIGGCYYAARLAVAELLEREGRQAAVVVLREAHPGYIMPIGVWNVRENVRTCVSKKPLTFHSLKEALRYISQKLEIKIDVWINESEVLKKFLYQKTLLDFSSYYLSELRS